MRRFSAERRRLIARGGCAITKVGPVAASGGTSMTDEEKIKKWVETWKRAGPALERIKNQELREWKYDPAVIDALIEAGLCSTAPRPMTGLVEQQRLFRKLRR